MNYKLESFVTKDGTVMMQLMAEGKVVAFASFPLALWQEFRGALYILQDKLEAKGLIEPPALDVQALPDAGSIQWN